MPLRMCEIDGCNLSAERRHGSCMICAGHFCWTHFRSSVHECPQEDSDYTQFYAAYDSAKLKWLERLVRKLRVDVLKATASKLRGGINCHIPALDSATEHSIRIDLIRRQTGGQNCHLDVDFEDGVSWIARIRLDDPTLPPEPTQEYIFMSEVSTLKFLENTTVPAPAVYHYELNSSTNSIGASYMLMQKLPGRPLNWPTTPAPQRSKIIHQLADIYIELSTHPFDQTGSLTTPTTIGPFAQAPLFGTPTSSLGPYSSLHAAYTAILTHQLQAITAGEIAQLPRENTLACAWQLAGIPDLLSTSDAADGPFYLKHPDDKGDHILVDEECNITGVIDWEWASAEAKEVAFSSPCVLWPVGEFYAGRNELALEEVEFAEAFRARGREDLARVVEGGRRWQRFLFFLRGGVPVDLAEFGGLFGGLWKLFQGEDERKEEFDTEGWVEEARKVCQQYNLFQELVST